MNKPKTAVLVAMMATLLLSGCALKQDLANMTKEQPSQEPSTSVTENPNKSDDVSSEAPQAEGAISPTQSGEASQQPTPTNGQANGGQTPINEVPVTPGSIPATPNGSNGASSSIDSIPITSSEGTDVESPTSDDDIQVVADPNSMTVVVNKQFALPASYKPNDLVFPRVPFIPTATQEKRQLRKEAAAMLEKMFTAAKNSKLPLAGVSAYRSYNTQKQLFAHYVKQDGEEKARTYSAVEGTSEHETGLAIDVTSISGKCAATDCFGGTPEAKWLEQHAHEYGFIIRYPKGKEAITGYQYEPWHLRYVGVQVAQELRAQGLTLEEYANVMPVQSQ